MSKNVLSSAFRSVGRSLVKHSPQILTGIGVAGIATTAVLAVHATPKATRLIEDAKEKKGSELTVKEKVKAAWKCYIPATISGVTSAVCIIGANSVNARRNAALAAAYKLSETAFIDYREKVVETVGKEQEKAVRESVVRDKIAKNPPNNQNIVIAGTGDVLCYDALCGRYFNSSMDKIDKIVNDLNRRMRSDMYISLNEFYYEVDLEGVAAGYELGWNIDSGYIDVSYSSQICPDGKPCLVVEFNTPPKYEYR